MVNIRVQCAWCRKEEIATGVWVKRDANIPGASHGICLECFVKMDAEIKAHGLALAKGGA